ncbi:MAG: glycine cleavage system aminomethyltransferase GcvT [Planctomycetota bacterium]|nr:glycine cleavage system aminomethyltransferase GcvT [Planctomycetota bacterium]
MKNTPLQSRHVRHGARLVEFGGWQMPVQYGPILEEVTRVRTHAGLFDLSHMGRVRVTGKDRVAYLDRLLTNHVAKIAAGSIRYALFCRADGMPIDDLLVYPGEGEVFLVVNASNTDVDLAWMREHETGFDVVIQDQTDELAMIAVQGPKSREITEHVVKGIDLAKLGYYKFAFGTVCGIPNVRVSRTGYTGELGYELYVPTQTAGRVWDEVLTAGAMHEIAPIGLGARDTLRLEAGMPLYGHEIDATHDPIQAGLEFGISFAPEKGDWIGRSALEAIRAKPTRRLVGLKTDGPRAPRQGYEVVVGGKSVGHVVSGSVSPTCNTNIGTAYVPVALGEPGTAAEIDVKGKRQQATFCALPFFSRTRK